MEETVIIIPKELRKRLEAETKKPRLHRSWTGLEVKILTEYYPKIGLRVSKYLPDRTRTAIYNKVDSLGLKAK